MLSRLTLSILVFLTLPNLATVRFAADVAMADDPDPVLEQSRFRVEPIDLQRDVDGAWSPAGLIEQPVLRFEERSRNNSGGSVWLWGETGRPAAVMELYQPADKPEDWCFVINNISGTKVRAFRGDYDWWQENESAVNMTPFPDTTPPAARPAARLAQMRSLARRFQAHEFWDPDHSRFNLRLLPQPLHRYADDEQGILDGTLFVFANGTNPEVCLLIEARAGDDRDAAWHYGLARLGHAEIHAHFDGESVWQVPRLDETPNAKPYWLWYASFPVETDAETPQQTTAP